eukprot:TRINITY_DN3934_c0_g1_i1.p1 TRINITY_DN3934_c0_g1~~TRINITY_DN3934_c0_g1_i1.p1  ORF type:complete len:1280 (-),score=400.29 TRINITY_DN3934_c0_g1_i1:153-3992(-)
MEPAHFLPLVKMEWAFNWTTLIVTGSICAAASAASAAFRRRRKPQAPRLAIATPQTTLPPPTANTLAALPKRVIMADDVPSILTSVNDLKAHAAEYAKTQNWDKAVNKYIEAFALLDAIEAPAAEQKELDKQGSIIQVNLALMHTRLSDPRSALANATRASELDPSNVKAWFRKSHAESALSLMQDSCASISKAVALEPSSAEIRKEAGRVFALRGKELLQLNDAPTAEKYLASALKYFPGVRDQYPTEFAQFDAMHDKQEEDEINKAIVQARTLTSDNTTGLDVCISRLRRGLNARKLQTRFDAHKMLAALYRVKNDKEHIALALKVLQDQIELAKQLQPTVNNHSHEIQTLSQMADVALVMEDGGGLPLTAKLQTRVLELSVEDREYDSALTALETLMANYMILEDAQEMLKLAQMKEDLLQKWENTGKADADTLTATRVSLFNQRGTAYRYMRSWKRCIQNMDHKIVIQLAEAADDSISLATLLTDLAEGYRAMGDFAMAELKALEAQRLLDNKRAAIGPMADPHKVIEIASIQPTSQHETELLRARIIESSRLHMGQSDICKTLSLIATARGQWSRALQIMQTCVDLLTPLKPFGSFVNSTISSLSKLQGDVLMRAGEFAKAQASYKSYLDNSMGLEDYMSRLIHIPRACQMLSRAMLQQKNAADTVELSSQGVAICKRGDIKVDEVVLLGLVGRAQLGNNELEEAGKTFDYMLQVARTAGHPRYIMRALWAVARGQMTAGKYSEAAETLTEAVELAKKQFDTPACVFSLGQLARTQMLLRDFDSAISSAELAVARSRVPGPHGDDPFVPSMAQLIVRAARLHQQVLVAAKRSDEALLAVLHEREFAVDCALFPEKHLLPNIHHLEPEESFALPPALNARITSIDQIKVLAAQQNAAFVVYTVIQREMYDGGRECSLQAFVYIWVVKVNGEVSLTVSDVEEYWSNNRPAGECTQQQNAALREELYVDAVVSAAQTAIAKNENVADHLLALSTVFLTPIESLVTDEPSIVIVPQGSLLQVPFAALKLSDGSYLVERASVSLCTNTAALTVRDDTPAAPTKRLCVYNVSTANFNAPHDTTASGVSFTSVPEQPFTDLAAADESVTVLSGATADKKTVLDAFASAEYAYVATDVFLFAESVVAVAAGSSAAAATDDFVGVVRQIADPVLESSTVNVRDILQLPATPRTVVLQGCSSSGAHPVSSISGEGLFALVTALQSKGTHSLVLWLWQQQSGSELTREVLNAGVLTQQSVRDVQRAAIARADAVCSWGALSYFLN